MFKRLIALILISGMAAYTTGCSSGSSEKSADSSESSASDLDAMDEGGGSSGSGDTAAAEGDSAAKEEGDILADLGEDNGDLKKDEAVTPAPEEAKAAEPAPSEPLTESPAVAQTEPTPSPSAGGEDLFGGAAAGAPADDTPKPMASLKKVKDAPYTEKGVLANTVYIARKGDDMASVEQKTGSTKKELKKLNSFLSRGVKVGDKIYYNSKARPTDSSKMMIYWEDIGVQPQTYTAKSGDNLKKVAKELLGHKDSWKELWATNPIESKDALNEGDSLRYWPGDASGATQAIAANNPPPIQEPPAVEPPPPPPPEPSPIQPAAPAAVEPPPPPPPPPADAPATPPKLAKKDNKGGFAIPGLGPDETFIVGGVALLLALGGALVAIKRGRAKKFSSQTQTQI